MFDQHVAKLLGRLPCHEECAPWLNGDGGSQLGESLASVLSVDKHRRG